jgi:hypothetical protein
MFPIAAQSGNGSSASITFSNIPQTFTHLQLRGIARSIGTGSQVYTRLNNDGGSNYATHYIYGDGSSVAGGTGGAPTTVNFFGSMPASTDTANTYLAFAIDILDYTNTNKNKTTKNSSGIDLNGVGGTVFFSSSVWMNTAAVTSLTFVANAGFTTLTNLQLYGISTSNATGA